MTLCPKWLKSKGEENATIKKKEEVAEITFDLDKVVICTTL
jgi:hypothetical protein